MNRTNPEESFFPRTAFVIIICFAIIRCGISVSMELGTDEAYYWFYSQDIKWNYFDHPPMVAIWIRAFTANLALQDIEGFIRLGSVVGCAIASWAVYKTGAAIHSAKAGLFGVCLYQASFFASVTAGIFIMPDAPQMVFYTLAMWMIARITKDEKDLMAWIGFGVMAGLCIMSKVYGAFLWAGFGLFAILKKRYWFSQPCIYVAFGVTAVIASPIPIWNFQNDFLSFRFHSARVAGASGGLDILNFGREVINQLLYNNPFNVVVSIAALILFLRKKKAQEENNDALSIFNFIALPQAAFFLLASLLGVKTLPHWSGPAYVALIPLAAIYLSGRTVPYAKKILLSSLGMLVLFLVVWQYLIHLAPSVIAERSIDKKNLAAEKSVVWRLLSGFASFQLIAPAKGSWEPAGETFLKHYQQETNKGFMKKNAPVICYDWGGAQIEYYFCHPTDIPVIGLGEPNDLHEYLFTNAERSDEVNLNTAYCIVPADGNHDIGAKYSAYYHTIEKPLRITVRKRNSNLAFYVYRLHGWKNSLPMVEPGNPVAD